MTSWADGSLYHHQTSNGALVQTLRLGAHPTDMVWRDRATRAEEADESGQQPNFKARIFVSAANTNNVYSVGVSDSGDLRVVETINVSTSPNHPLGMTPSALALSADQSRLYVVCSDANAAGSGGCHRGTQPGARFRSHRLVSDRGARARRWPPGRSERQGFAKLSNPKGPNPASRQN